MAVKRVFGKADGVNITFTPGPDGRWRCAIPSNLNGQYIVELYAEDFAGNIGYLATALFTVDTAQLCVRVRWLDIAARADMGPLSVQMFGGVRFSMCPWEITVKSFELCGRR